MVQKKIITAKEAAAMIKDGDRLMIGGFLGCGVPLHIINELIAQKTKNLTLICNDTGIYNPDKGIVSGPAGMVAEKQFSTIIASHIGTNRETGRQMTEGETEVCLVPQGTLAEQIRSAGNGLGGFLTPTGVGTEVEKGKQVIEIDGKSYLLEKPLSANVAIIKAHFADKVGNLMYNKSARNFNPIMAMAADLVIAEVDEIVETGELNPECIATPSIFVNYLVKKEKDK